MKLRLERFFDDKKGTLGILFVDNVFECFTCEDTFRSLKVKGKTRIPSGQYWIDFRRVVSNKTKSYRKRYKWFNYHLQLQNVPKFEYVYIHIGNNATHSEGCILVGDQANKYGLSGAEVLKSRVAFNAIYKKVSGALDSGKRVSIEIKDNP